MKKNHTLLIVLVIIFNCLIIKAQISFTDIGQQFGSGYISNITFGDVNGDGYSEALITYSKTATQVWLNDKLGHFTYSGQSLTSEGEGMAMGVALGDFDADHDLDAFIIYINESGTGKPNEVWINDGEGNFTDSGQKLGQRCSSGIALADLDGDRDIDAFVCNHLGKNISTGSQIWLNNGKGVFTDNGQDLGSLNQNHYSVDLGDIDGDGDIDALVTSGFNNDPSKNQIWINDGKGNFTGKVLSTYDSGDLALGDLDKDGDLDILITYQTGTKIYLNDGKGDFTISMQCFGTIGSSGADLGDIDNDGDLDAIIKNSSSSSIWLNDGKGNFLEAGIILQNGDGGAVKLIDLNNDGFLDCLAGSRIYMNNKSSVSIKTNNQDKDLVVFSNPAHGLFTISLGTAYFENANLEIYNINGSLIITEKLSKTNLCNIDITDYPKGIYLTKLKVDGVLYTNKLCNN
jgi:hypothetical protein